MKPDAARFQSSRWEKGLTRELLSCRPDDRPDRQRKVDPGEWRTQSYARPFSKRGQKGANAVSANRCESLVMVMRPRLCARRRRRSSASLVFTPVTSSALDSSVATCRPAARTIKKARDFIVVGFRRDRHKLQTIAVAGPMVSASAGRRRRSRNR